MEDFGIRTARLDTLLGVGRNFDMVARDVVTDGRRGRLWVVNGYAEDALLERVIGRLLAVQDLHRVPDLDTFLAASVTIPDAVTETDESAMLTGVFAGKTLLLIDGFDGGVLLDAKEYPTRGVEEPDTSKVLRGSHDGFVESIMANAALLRRRIRDPALTLERHQIGGRSRTDVALVYMAGEANEEHLRQLRSKLDSIDVGSISMSQESVAECIVPKQWWNPFPKVRFTERPDVATASVMEGTILLMVDNSPSVMLLPTTLFSFAEEINDYYFPPLIGTYLQLVRLVVLFLTVVITPLWPEVLVYMAFVAVAGYAQHSYEMGYACKMVRMVLLVLIWLWDTWGFILGIVGAVALIASTKPVVGKGYLYPLLPFNGKRLLRLLLRRPIDRDNT